MIDRLRRKFIKLCMLSFLAVFLVLFAAIYLITAHQTAASLDMLADIIVQNDGRFPAYEEFFADGSPVGQPDAVNQESPFTTRFFTVRFDTDGQVLSVDLGAIASVTQQQAAAYAESALMSGAVRGWLNDFRYMVSYTDEDIVVVLVNGTDSKQTSRRFLLSTCSVFAGGSLVVLLIVILFSKRAVRTTAESYEKQKQFITDANHELKTPLTLIRTNLDILEEENGTSEWLNDIREETAMLSVLVDRLVTLTRMDEEQTTLEHHTFDLSEAVGETLSAFAAAAQSNGRSLETAIVSAVTCVGDEAAIRQLIAILLDNAVKYCDAGGVIRIVLTGGRHPVLTIDNSYAAVNSVALDRLFDRFYRADPARTSGNGFGIGLAIAQAVAEKHRAEITVLRPCAKTIRFRVRF